MEEYNQNLEEDKGSIIKDPPQTLILQKKAIQQFPNNQKVVLYYCEALKKYFSFTYDKNGMGLTESVNIKLVDKLKLIEEVEPVLFFDGSALNIDKECAEHILDLYDSLSEGKEEFEDYIEESKSNFLEILKYSVKNKQDN